MGLFDQITCGCSNENTSCTTDNEPTKNVGVGSTTPAEPAPAPKPASVQSCCNVGVGSSSPNVCETSGRGRRGR